MPRKKKEVVGNVEAVATTLKSETFTTPSAVEVKPSFVDYCNCKHEKGLHYGGEKGWCNAQGCRCVEFK